MNENIQGYIRSFAAFSGAQYAGSLIVRLQYERKQKAGPQARFTAKIVKENRRRQMLVAEGWNDKQFAGKLQMELWFPRERRTPHSKKESEQLNAGQPLRENFFWRAFSPEEIRAFSRRTGDTNPIHLQGHPVVQGLLLWQTLFAHLAEPAALLLTFHRPVHGGEKIYLREEIRNEQNKREFALCGSYGGAQFSGTDIDPKWRLCRATDGIGVSFFSAAFYTG